MGKLLNLISKIQKLDPAKVAENAINEVADEFTKAQKDQLLHGETSEGGTLRQYRNKAYARKKNAMNALPGLGNPDLKLTGKFYQGITTVASGGRVVIKSSDSKAQELEASYGKDKIFGLHQETKSQLIKEKLRPAFNRNIKKEIRL